MKGELIPKNPGVVYIIPNNNEELNLEVKYSANAWWMNRLKVTQLLASFAYDCPIRESCAAAGITLRQYKYFVRVHPIVREIRESTRVIPTLKARMAIVQAISDGNLKMCRWWLEKKRPGEFSPRERHKVHRYADWMTRECPIEPVKITMVHTVNNIEYTDEEHKSPDFEKIRAERERAQTGAV